jgi:hypothetical protein
MSNAIKLYIRKPFVSWQKAQVNIWTTSIRCPLSRATDTFNDGVARSIY